MLLSDREEVTARATSLLLPFPQPPSDPTSMALKQRRRKRLARREYCTGPPRAHGSLTEGSMEKHFQIRTKSSRTPTRVSNGSQSGAQGGPCTKLLRAVRVPFAATIAA